MAHANTERLLDYWRAARGPQRAPRRADVDPTGFPGLAARAFVAALGEDGRLAFRLAGEEVIALYRRPLRGAVVADLWRPEHRGRVVRLAALSARTAEPLVVLSEAAGADGFLARVELLIAPLQGVSGRIDRFLGLHQLLSGGDPAPLGALNLIDAAVASMVARPSIRLAAIDGRRLG